MDTVAKRIEAALLAKNGGNQSEMARFIGVSPQAVQKWIAGEAEPRGQNLKLAAQYLGMTEAVLKFGDAVEYPTAEQTARRRAVTPHHPDDGIEDGFVYVAESRVRFSAGNGHTASYELLDDDDPAQYRLSWFQKQRINPKQVKRFRVTGESMEPLLYENDTILVNLAETNIVDGKLYAIRYGDDLRVKYVSKRLDGTLILKSVNPQYPPEEVPAATVEEHISIIGRVRDRSGTGGL